MIKLILRIILIALALLALPHIVPGIMISNFWTALLVAIVWGIINVTLKPLLHLLALPITILTLGLFAFIINALLFWLVAAIIPGFAVTGFVAALLGSLVLTIVNWLLHTAL